MSGTDRSKKMSENTPILSEVNLIMDDKEYLMSTNGGVLATLSALVGGGICTISYGINDTGLIFVGALIVFMNI